jgi:hypothetical protein
MQILYLLSYFNVDHSKINFVRNATVHHIAIEVVVRQATYTLQGISRTSSTNPSKIIKQIDANAALHSTSHCKKKQRK